MRGVDEDVGATCLLAPPLIMTQLRTAPIDFRFPSTNQARTCYTHYNEYYKYVVSGGGVGCSVNNTHLAQQHTRGCSLCEPLRCVADKGEDSKDCIYHKRFYSSICPNEWV